MWLPWLVAYGDYEDKVRIAYGDCEGKMKMIKAKTILKRFPRDRKDDKRLRFASALFYNRIIKNPWEDQRGNQKILLMDDVMKIINR